MLEHFKDQTQTHFFSGSVTESAPWSSHMLRSSEVGIRLDRLCIKTSIMIVGLGGGLCIVGLGWRDLPVTSQPLLESRPPFLRSAWIRIVLVAA